MRTSNSIPILLITGFLGSGKTTLLNGLLSNTKGLKIGVIVNDFGDINIDSLLVASQTDQQLELSNGCICCSVDDDDLDDAISKLAHRGSMMDYIIIEASGLAEPRDLATMLRVMKNEYAHFDGLVNVVDGQNFAKNNQTHPGAIDTLSFADIILISKVDLISKDELAEIEQGIRMVNKNARIMHAADGDVDSRLLMEDVKSSEASSQLSLGDDHSHSHLHEEFSSVSFSTNKPLDPQAFEEWSKNLDPNIFRAKGFCYFGVKGVEQKYIFHSVSGRSKLKLDEWAPDEAPQTNLVVIGRDLDEKAVTEQLESLVDTKPDNVNQDTLMDVFKYR